MACIGERAATALDTASVLNATDFTLGDFSITPTHPDSVLAYSTNQRFTDVLQGVWRVFSRRFEPYGVEPHKDVNQVCDLTHISPTTYTVKRPSMRQLMPKNQSSLCLDTYGM